MDISVHLRGGHNLTDLRTLPIAAGLEALGHRVSFRGREEGAAGDDLVIQTGFARTQALLSAIEQEIPYLVMEAPFWRHIDINATSSWGYNGLAGGAFRHAPLMEPRGHPELQELHTEGNTLIIGQKPTDHSLRGADHGKWLKAKFEQYPDAIFRPHPLMVLAGTSPPLDDALRAAGTVISYTSTVGVEALIAGCTSAPEHRGSMAYNVSDRAEWLHRLSYGQFTHEEYNDPRVAEYVLEGYSEALARAEQGLQEIPRGKQDGQLIQRRYYRDILSNTASERALG